MLRVKSEVLELRGIANKTSKKGNVFYTINVEDMQGSPYALYCPDASCLPQNLKKGDSIVVDFEVRVYAGQEQLIVRGVTKNT